MSCSAKTLKGLPCKRKPIKNTNFCPSHKEKKNIPEEGLPEQKKENIPKDTSQEGVPKEETKDIPKEDPDLEKCGKKNCTEKCSPENEYCDKHHCEEYCNGRTKAGKRCGNRKKNGNFCHLHGEKKKPKYNQSNTGNSYQYQYNSNSKSGFFGDDFWKDFFSAFGGSSGPKFYSSGNFGGGYGYSNNYSNANSYTFDSKSDYNDAVKFLELKGTPLAADIKKKYRELALKYHPDKGGKEEDFKNLGKHYEYLRKFYGFK